MENQLATWEILRNSLFGSDIIILFAAMVTFIVFMMVNGMTKSIKAYEKKWEVRRNKQFTKFLLRRYGTIYTIFTTLISIFPLLGMLGTVMGLLGLKFENNNMDNLKANFFIALTSTAWGIIFSIIFKILNAIIVDKVEEHMERARILSEDIPEKEKK